MVNNQEETNIQSYCWYRLVSFAYDGLVPEFLTGLHYGCVMVGEIGVVKGDIAFS